MISRSPSLIDRYRSFLPVKPNQTIVTLGEGDTTLIRLKNLPRKHINVKDIEVYVKYEGRNPTGSFKDRGMTMAITQALHRGSRSVICASTGNTSASAAAYAARANMTCFVLIPEGKIAQAKLVQAMMYGAVIVQLKGNFDDAMSAVKQVAEQLPLSIVNSINPDRIQGQKTAAFEIVDELGEAPDMHYLPVGNAGNITAYWMGYQEYHRHQNSKKNPLMIGYQASGSAPFLRGAPIDSPETIASAIRIGRPQSWEQAVEAVEASGGRFGEVGDEKILEAQYLLAREEGVFCEPASAASIAGLLNDCQRGLVSPGSVIVCTLTGNGLKDSDSAMQSCQKHATMVSVDSSLEKIHEVISAHLVS